MGRIDVDWLGKRVVMVEIRDFYGRIWVVVVGLNGPRLDAKGPQSYRAETGGVAARIFRARNGKAELFRR
jgi:hypothetical protein